MYKKIYDDNPDKDFDYWAFYVPKRIKWDLFKKFIKGDENEEKTKSIEMEK